MERWQSRAFDAKTGGTSNKLRRPDWFLSDNNAGHISVAAGFPIKLPVPNPAPNSIRRTHSEIAMPKLTKS